MRLDEGKPTLSICKKNKHVDQLHITAFVLVPLSYKISSLYDKVLSLQLFNRFGITQTFPFTSNIQRYFMAVKITIFG